MGGSSQEQNCEISSELDLIEENSPQRGSPLYYFQHTPHLASPERSDSKTAERRLA